MTQSRLSTSLTLRNNGEKRHANSEKKIIIIIMYFSNQDQPHINQQLFFNQDLPCVFVLCKLKWQRANGNSNAGWNGSPLPVDAPLFPDCCMTRCVDFEMGAWLHFRGSLWSLCGKGCWFLWLVQPAVPSFELPLAAV